MKFSVIITSYYGSWAVKESADSFLSLGFKDFELIVVDDCSTDGTISKMNEYDY